MYTYTMASVNMFISVGELRQRLPNMVMVEVSYSGKFRESATKRLVFIFMNQLCMCEHTYMRTRRTLLD